MLHYVALFIQCYISTALLDIKPRLRRVKGHLCLPKLREALQRELKIEAKRIVSVEEAA